MDLLEARDHLLKIIGPFPVRLYSFVVEHKLGYDMSGKGFGPSSNPAKGGDYRPNLVFYSAEVKIDADYNQYPRGRSSLGEWALRSNGTDLDNVLAVIEQQTQAVALTWQDDMDQDAALASHVGQGFVMAQETSIRVKKEGLSGGRRVVIAKGLHGKVAEHKPGFLKLEFAEVYDTENQLRILWMPHRQVESVYYRYAATDTERRGPMETVPDPFITFE